MTGRRISLTIKFSYLYNHKTLADKEDGMIKVDIVNKISEQTGISKVKAIMAVETIFNVIKEAMKRGERIELRGFGVFQVKPRKRGIGRNPRTGDEVQIPPGKTIKFKPGKNLKDLSA